MEDSSLGNAGMAPTQSGRIMRCFELSFPFLFFLEFLVNKPIRPLLDISLLGLYLLFFNDFLVR